MSHLIWIVLINWAILITGTLVFIIVYEWRTLPTKLYTPANDVKFMKTGSTVKKGKAMNRNVWKEVVSFSAKCILFWLLIANLFCLYHTYYDINDRLNDLDDRVTLSESQIDFLAVKMSNCTPDD